MTRDIIYYIIAIVFFFTILVFLWIAIYYLVFYPLARMAVLGNATDRTISIIVFVLIGMALTEVYFLLEDKIAYLNSKS